jgi:hypothetical protein
LPLAATQREHHFQATVGKGQVFHGAAMVARHQEVALDIRLQGWRGTVLFIFQEHVSSKNTPGASKKLYKSEQTAFTFDRMVETSCYFP